VTRLAQLEADAEAKRSRLEHTLRNLGKRATVLGLVDDLIARSGAPTSDEVAEALRRNLLLAIGLAFCAGLLAVEVRRARRLRPVKSRERRDVAQAHHTALSPIP
jgi:hypothetical protein